MEMVRVEKPCLKIHSASSSSSSSSAGLTGMERNYEADNRIKRQAVNQNVVVMNQFISKSNNSGSDTH